MVAETSRVSRQKGLHAPGRCETIDGTVRRKLTTEEAAERRIGKGVRAVMDAEKGKPSTGHRRLFGAALAI